MKLMTPSSQLLSRNHIYYLQLYVFYSLLQLIKDSQCRFVSIYVIYTYTTCNNSLTLCHFMSDKIVSYFTLNYGQHIGQKEHLLVHLSAPTYIYSKGWQIVKLIPY